MNKTISYFFFLAAEAFGTCMCVSMLATTSFEDVAKAAPNTIFLMQFYIYNKRDLTYNLIEKVENAGYKGIVVTVDAAAVGQRRAAATFRLPSHLQLENFIKDIPRITSNDERSSGLKAYKNKIPEHRMSWKDIAWLRSATKLPIFLKGITSYEDALEASKYDVQGIIVSNHGGRQLDSGPATVSYFLTFFYLHFFVCK